MSESLAMTHACKILVLMGHPDLDSFGARAAQSYTDQARALGADVTQINLVELSFDLVLRHGYRKQQPLEPDLQRARDALVDADHIAFAFPMWWSSSPALVKGFIDRVFTPGFAFAYPSGGGVPKRLLTGRSARFLTTMDAPSFWYKLRLRSPLHASFVTGTLKFVGFSPVRTTTLYGMRQLSAAAREAALEQMRRCAAQDISALSKKLRRGDEQRDRQLQPPRSATAS